MAPEEDRPICDIVIPVWNQLEYTKECLNSLFKSTSFPFRLIVVDNASDTRTAQYLDSIKEKNPEQVSLIRNSENLGFIKAVNQGIKESAAPYVCLLNNDTQVAEGWLTEMVKVADTRDDIGIVNPNSNTLGWKSKKRHSPETVAQELKPYSGEYSKLPWASGFCMLIKRKVIQEIGLFDQIYGMGTFEDADFSKRAQRAGFLSVCAKAAYVYHRERRSFIKFKKFDRDFERNRQIFFAKWGRIERILYILTKHNPAYTERINTEAVKLACQGSIIWIFLKGKDSQGINEHSNVYIYNLPGPFFSLVSIWRILKRKKKFDRIYADDEDYAKRLNNFKLFHKAEVVYAQ
ncbi:MAG: glycosyltransferase family 2 protein [Candidatus Omnitrophica bacterium]|nr:glycosyltransferase family 2 protein [Candidatus Omnitrophota bacterium]